MNDESLKPAPCAGEPAEAPAKKGRKRRSKKDEVESIFQRFSKGEAKKTWQVVRKEEE